MRKIPNDLSKFETTWLCVNLKDALGFDVTEAQSVNKKNCFEEVRFFGTILWRELKSYQKIAQLTERKKEQARLHARFLALALCSHQCVCSLRS